jgi:hypothetical protein
MIEFTEEQKAAYARFIKARDRIGLVPRAATRKGKWVRQADVQSTVDIAGYNHPFYEPNPIYQEYKEASAAWWAIEPQFRKDERMRMTRGDYGKQDSWDERATHIPDSYNKIEKEGV